MMIKINNCKNNNKSNSKMRNKTNNNKMKRRTCNNKTNYKLMMNNKWIINPIESSNNNSNLLIEI
mgnify:CR=1 FL=1